MVMPMATWDDAKGLAHPVEGNVTLTLRRTKGGNPICNITARRMISGCVLNLRKGDRLVMSRRFGTALPASSPFPLTVPFYGYVT